ncbi:MAG: hypothetical protein ABWX67_11810 [Allosphingosinicella sp.]
MRMIALAALALGLSACGDRGGSTDEANALTADNMAMNELMSDTNMVDSNAAAGGLDANASTNAATENLMAKDAVTNDPDTNLANGL